MFSLYFLEKTTYKVITRHSLHTTFATQLNFVSIAVAGQLRLRLCKRKGREIRESTVLTVSEVSILFQMETYFMGFLQRMTSENKKEVRLYSIFCALFKNIKCGNFYTAVNLLQK